MQPSGCSHHKATDPVFRSVLERFEFYVAYRILCVALTFIVCILALCCSPRTLGMIFFASGCLFILAVPFVLVWGVCVFVTNLRRF
jgi:hypothetical protein